MASLSHLFPGEETEIHVKVDTKYKKGKTHKMVYVYTNDPLNQKVILRLKAYIKDVYHETKQEAKAIFFQPCSKCHVERGRGLSGRRLFFADCIMCHRQGATGPSLSELEKLPREALKKKIEKGVPETVMPPFLDRLGGPLNKSIIKSLVNYIKNTKR